MRACPHCETKGLLVALQPKGPRQECPNCGKLYPPNAGREVSDRELRQAIMATIKGG